MDKIGFGAALERLRRSHSELPIKLANQASRFFLSSFKNEGWNDGGMNHWAVRKDQNNTRNLLVKSGALRRAVADSVKEASWNRIRFVVDIPYAKAHNEGTQNAGRNHSTVIPQRQFVGDSATLRKMQVDLIKEELNKVFGL